MKKTKYFVAVALLAGTLVSCERENISSNFNNNGKIGVTVSGTEGVKTKADASEAELIATYAAGEADGIELRIDAYESDYDALPFADELLTKGSIVTDDGANGTVNINSDGKQFTFKGWLGSENRYPDDEGGSEGRVNNEDDATNFNFLNATATKNGSWSLSPTSEWRNAVPTTFWSWYPVTDNARVITVPGGQATDDEQKRLSFVYTTPADVASQNDLLFAYNLHTVSYDDDGELEENSDPETVDIHFYHALAAIRFDVAGALADKVQINSVYFKNLVTKATCQVAGTGQGGNPGTVAFTWGRTSTGEVSQTLTAGDFTATGLDGETEKALMPLNSSKFFFLIPQAFQGVSTPVELGITYTRSDGTTDERTYEIDHKAWEPGKIYTYKLNPAEDIVNVEVIEDKVEGSVKEGVSVKNTGNVKAFIRVAIVGNWCSEDSEGNPVINQPWIFDKGDSAFTGWNDTNWTYDENTKWFYSKEPVEAGKEKELFGKFTASEGPGGANLHVDIIAQAVAAGKDNTSWNQALGNN